MRENEFYSRQINLKEIGESGQKKIQNTKVLIIGAGGLGHPAGQYLAAAGVGELCFLDFDKVELSNLNRQVLFTPGDEGKYKAEVLAQRLAQQNPLIKVEGLTEKLTPENAERIISQFDMVLDCCDNFPTKFLIHDVCWLLKKDLIQASLYQFEGQVQNFPYSTEREKGCLRCLWEKVPSQSCTGTCAQAGIVGAVAGTLGAMQAMEAVKTILGLDKPSTLSTTTLNLLSLETQKLKWKKNSSCPLCSPTARINGVDLKEYQSREEFELIGIEHSEMILVDIREEEELGESINTSFIHRPLSKIEEWKKKLDSKRNYLFICSKGIRSYKLVSRLRLSGSSNYFSLFGGLENYESTLK